ncbi:MAG: hypothetical protein AAGF87_04700, partial [Bacteroidota bacterium]
MKAYILLVVALMGSQSLIGQCTNLVPNGSFETFSALPDDDCDWELAIGWTNANTSTGCTPANGSPDYFHVLGTGPFSSLPVNNFATVNPIEGDAIMGIATFIDNFANFREYIAIQLSAPLIVGQDYSLSFYATAGVGTDRYFSNNLGASLSVGPILQNMGNAFNFAPTFEVTTLLDNEDWEQFTFTFTATQAFDHLTIGNFRNDNQTLLQSDGSPGFFGIAYYFVDDIVITQPNTPVAVDLGPDQTICLGNSITLDAGNPGANYLWSTNETTQTINISASGTYSVTVDNGCNTASDEIVIDVLPIETQTVHATFCAGGSFELNGQTYTMAGTYTQFIPGGGANGCDLEITINLSENFLETQTINDSFCQGDSYILNGQTYTAGGTYVQLLTGGGTDGCDLEITLNLTENLSETQTIDDSFCAGQSYTLNGQTYTSAGTYTQIIPGGASNGCDLVITLNLSENFLETQTINDSFCQGDSYTLNGQTYTAGGTYVQLLTGGGTDGCDLEITLNLTENTTETQTINESFCQGGGFELNGEAYTAAGTYTQVQPGAGSNGCDLEITLNLSENTIESQTINESFCQGGSFELNGEVYTAAGTYTQVQPGASSNGCDLEITLNLAENAVETQTINESFCQGGSFELNG